MGIKEELEKLVKAESAKLQAQDTCTLEHRARQVARFQVARNLLSDLANAVDSEYLEVILSDSSARIKLGIEKSSTDFRWEIQPNFSFNFQGNDGKLEYQDEEGFKGEETHYYGMPDYDIVEKHLKFKSEEEILEYLMKVIAEKVAFYQKLKEARRERDKSV